MLSVDGTNYKVPEQGLLFFSHKFGESGVRYEITLCLLTGDCVWVYRPFEYGPWSDINIFNHSLKHHLSPFERVEADDGYVGGAPLHIKCLTSFTNPEETLFMQQRIRNRKETINKRLKQWGILKQVYQYDIGEHSYVLRAILVLIQTAINNSKNFFLVDTVTHLMIN